MGILQLMPTTDPDRIDVAVGVVRNPGALYLIQQRQVGKPCEGQWEFPGGKVEPGESPENALCRELREELGIRVQKASQLMLHKHNYDHANVLLHVFLVDSFEGSVESKEGQLIQWKDLEQILELEVLEAVHPIVQALAEVRPA